MWGAAILVAGLSYCFVRLSPAEIAARNAYVSGFLITPARPLQVVDEVSRANGAKLSARRGRGESAEKIAQDLKRALRGQYEMFTPDGRLNDQILEVAGIPSAKRDVVQQVFDDTTEAVSASLRTRMVPDEEKTDPTKQIQAYRIPADPEEAERLLSSFKKALASTCGETSAAILLEFYEPQNRFGNFGCCDMTLERGTRRETRMHVGRPDESIETGEFYIEFVATKPGTTEQVVRISCVEGRGFERKHFGSLLEPPPWQ